MSFCTYSREFTANMFTSVENQFITKYLPQADGDAVRAYLYGLYLCQCSEEFDAESAAKLLRIPLEKLVDIFLFWEDCDLVHVLSRSPLYLEYLPVNAAVGKPKPVRPEKYAEFNREFYKLLQRAGKDFKPYEMQRVLEFLERQPMEQQAFLLVAEYCVKKDGAKLSSAHILNKAEKLCRERKYTYEQVQEDLAGFNLHEKELSHIFTLLGIYRKIQESDYDYLEKWSKSGVEIGAVYAAAETLKKGSLATLDTLVGELAEKQATGESAAREYLARREKVAAVVFKVARKLGVKVQNPRPYAEEYCEKWLERGFGEEELVLLAGIGMRMGYGFPEMDALLDTLYKDGVVESEGVRAYCADKDRQLKLLQKLQTVCGVIKKTQSALDMIETWRTWNFSDEMIMEAAKRSAGASSPLPYINKLLSEWKRTNVYSPDTIPERIASQPFKSEAAIAADRMSEREHYYAVLRQRAVETAERAQKLAEEDEQFREADAILRKGEIELARAEVFNKGNVPAIEARLAHARAERAEALKRLHLREEDLSPHCLCKKCGDTGRLPDGRLCDCYKG